MATLIQHQRGEGYRRHDAEAQVRIPGQENALKESEAAQRYAERVSQFIQEAVTSVATN